MNPHHAAAALAWDKLGVNQGLCRKLTVAWLIAVPPDGTLTVKVNVTGAFSGRLLGGGATLNVVDGDDEFTVTATETFWIMLPLTPVIGNVYAPGAAPEAFTVNVDDPGSVATEVGENEPVTPGGVLVPDVRATDALNPLTADTLTVD